MSSARTPHTSAAALGDPSRAMSRTASNPSVWAAMYASSTSPSHSITCSMAWKSATSVPGRMARCRSAKHAVSVRRGSTTTIFISGRACLAASMRRKSTGCANAALDPAMKRQSACSMSS
jgi:hypothetical protein